MDRPVEFETILKTYNHGDIAFIQSLLKANDITFFIEGEHFMQLRPLVQPAVIKVDKTRVDDAREILKDFKSGNFGYEI